MEYHIIKRFKYTSGDSMYSHIRTEKTIEKAIEKRLYLEKLEDSKCKPHYYLKEVVESLEIANAKLKAYQIIETDKNDNYFIVPFNENALLLTEEVA